MNKGPGNLEERGPGLDNPRKASEKEMTVELRLDRHVGCCHLRLSTSPCVYRFVLKQDILRNNMLIKVKVFPQRPNTVT